MGTDSQPRTESQTRTGAEDVAWDLDSLIDGWGDGTAEGAIDALLNAAEDGARALTADAKGTIAGASPSHVRSVLDREAKLLEVAHRAANYAQLRFATDTEDPSRGAAVAMVGERLSKVSAELVWLELELVAVDDDEAAKLLDDEDVAPYRHHLETLRAGKPHVLSEIEERLLANTAPTGASAWARLFTEQTSAVEVTIDGEAQPLDGALSLISHPDRTVRAAAAEAVTDALLPGLRTRAYIFNTLMADRRIQDDLRGFPTWISSWNLSNEASDASVQALVDAVVARYDIPQRWYALKAQVLGIDVLADYDRAASVATSQRHIEWSEATTIVRDAYASFSPELAGIVGEFIDEGWIDAPTRPAKRGGAFCAYTVPAHHPYVMLNYTATPTDVMTLAHELGHGVHGYLARTQGIFAQSTPLTVAETASVFGETVTFNRLVDMVDDPGERFALLAQNVEGSIATVFRQVAMNRFENAVHTHRRESGELSTDDFAEHWTATQAAMFGDSVAMSEGYRHWWSYIPHFIHTPGYVYAYAYGQLLALSVYATYRERGDEFVPQYLKMLRAGGSMWPEELGRIVDVDLADPGFWDAGLDLVDAQVTAAAEAAVAAGRVQ